MRRGRRWIVWAVVAVWLGAAVFVFGFLKPKAYRIPSDSMTPTLRPGDRFIATGLGTPQRGDIVVVRRGSTNFVRRVAARSGDRLYVLADNRRAGDDSRTWGPVPEDSVRGKVRFRLLAPERIRVALDSPRCSTPSQSGSTMLSATFARAAR